MKAVAVVGTCGGCPERRFVRIDPFNIWLTLPHAMSSQVCTRCGTVGQPAVRGSFAIELVLWLLFCAPGIIYTIWRLASPKVCKACGGPVIPVDSPAGIAITAGRKCSAPNETAVETSAQAAYATRWALNQVSRLWRKAPEVEVKPQQVKSSTSPEARAERAARFEAARVKSAKTAAPPPDPPPPGGA